MNKITQILIYMGDATIQIDRETCSKTYTPSVNSTRKFMRVLHEFCIQHNIQVRKVKLGNFVFIRYNF